MESVEVSAFIIDDDFEAINLLVMFLRQFPYIRVVGKTTSPIEGLALVNRNFPDLLFLDIDMPDLSGLQVAEYVKTKNFHSEIIFTTAYQHYAYEALSVEPLDFLTKPFSPDDLERVIKKYITKAERKKHEQKLDIFIQSQSNLPKITLPTVHSFLIVEIKDIVIVKAITNGTVVCLHDGTIETISKNLKEVISLINSTLIFEIRRGTYVNLNYIERIDKKKRICFIRFNNSLSEESIRKNNIINFEKLEIFPVV